LRLTRLVDWVFMRVPVVNLIFRAVNNVFQSLSHQFQGEMSSRRVVLIPFPQSGMRSLAFVTSSLHDTTTGKTILCVCMLTGVMPPAGFTLFVPEEDVTDVDWTMNQSLQVIFSGGITTPATIPYFAGQTAPPTGPIVDPQGHPIGVAATRPGVPDGLPPTGPVPASRPAATPAPASEGPAGN
jgi:uncharacterized membrane protein